MSKRYDSYKDRLIDSFARSAPDINQIELVPMRELGRQINKLAPHLGVAAFANPYRRTIVVFTNNHYYQMSAEQFARPELMRNVSTAAYAIVQSIPELRDRMGRVG